MKFISRKPAAAVASLVSALLLTAACGSQAASGDASGEPFRIAALGNYSSSLAQEVAIRQNFFKDQGLDVKLIPTASGPAAAALVTSGGAEVGYVAGPQVLAAAASGKPTKFLNDGETNNFELIGLKSEEGQYAGKPYPQNVLELKGKKIGVPALGSAVDGSIRSMLVDAGLDPEKDVDIIATGGPQTTIAALKQGQIQYTGFAAALTQTVYASALDTYVVGSTADDTAGTWGQNLLAWTPMVLAKTVQDRSDDVKSYCAAMSETITWMQDPANLDQVAKIAEDWLGLDAQNAKTASQAVVATQFDPLTEKIWDANASLFPDAPKVAFDDVVVDTCA